jgi:hypothetical protein
MCNHFSNNITLTAAGSVGIKGAKLLGNDTRLAGRAGGEDVVIDDAASNTLVHIDTVEGERRGADMMKSIGVVDKGVAKVCNYRLCC